MLPWSNLNVIYINNRISQINKYEGWIGSEDEETRLSKDNDIYISIDMLRKVLLQAKRIFDTNNQSPDAIVSQRAESDHTRIPTTTEGTRTSTTNYKREFRYIQTQRYDMIYDTNITQWH
jgi:hypothetical protein